MKLREEQIRYLAEKICGGLVADALIVPKQGRGVVVDAIAAVISQDLLREQTLENDAERMLDDTIAAMGRGAADIDRRRMLRMIKEKLARDRGIVL